MAIAERRIQFILQRERQSFIVSQAGIPAATVSYVARGLRSLPSQYNEAVRRLYQREAYATMRSVGMSVTQSNRFKWYTPEKVSSVLTDFMQMTTALADALTVNRLARDYDTFSRTDELDEWNQSYSDIVESISQSPKNYEDWLDYAKNLLP